MNQHIRYHQMSIECQYMSNICQTQIKGKWDNKTNKRNKREQEKGPRGASRSKGSKTSNITRYHMTSQDMTRHHNTDKVSQTRRFEGFEDSLKASETLQWFREGFPLT